MQTPQAKINELLISKTSEGKVVVRLKGGDPFLFGRGAEEAIALRTAGVSFEVVPGISSALAVPAYAGIPLTHRGLASAQPVAGTKGASFPFWSPDSRFIGFFADGKLKKIDAGGGPPQTLCDAPRGFGGTWNRDGVIVFAPEINSALYRVSAAGGASAPLPLDKSRKEQIHHLPYFLPDGRHFIYRARTKALQSRSRFGVYQQRCAIRDSVKIPA